MAGPPSLPEGGIAFTWAPSVEPLNIPVRDFLLARPLVSGAATSALVFSRATGPDRVLLVQRAPHDSMPLRWEAPGGACDAGADGDATLLHGLARELWEETGLRLRRVVRQVGPEYVFCTRRGLAVAKITFEAEVDAPPSGALPDVTLDPNEHVRFLWATEDECRLGKADVSVGGSGSGSGQREVVDINFTTEQQRSVVLLGFEHRKKASTGGEAEA